MTKLDISTDSKEIVLYYYEAISKRVDNRQIGRFTNMAKALLLEYTKDEIRATIDYCVKHQPSGGIYSFGYIVACIEEVVEPIRKQVFIEQAREQEANDKDIGSLPKATDNTNKLKRIGNRKEFDWDA